ncbi:hypothetical protein [Streptomyces microflavus]|uniref:hypothetical protein n=1 Tax=Streptomyces microflavus TaxID=1919 RepID=UPI0036603786
MIIIVGRSLQTIERNCLDVLQDLTLFGELAAEVRHTRGATTVETLRRVVHLVGATDARAEGRLSGMTAAHAYADEVTLLPPAFFRQLLEHLSALRQHGAVVAQPPLTRQPLRMPNPPSSR